MQLRPIEPVFRVRGKNASVAMRIFLNGYQIQKTLKFALGDLAMWDNEEQYTTKKGRKHQPKFDYWKNQVKILSDKYQELRIIPSREELSEALDQLIEGHGPVDNSKPSTLIGYIDAWLKDESKQFYIRDNQRKPYSRPALNNKQQLLKSLENFSRNVRPIDFKDIDLQFYDDFMSFLGDLSLNTKGKYVKELKTFLREAEAEGYQVNPAYKSRKFVVLSKPADDNKAIAVPVKDLEKIMAMELPEHLAIHRDWFIIGCFTGFRVGDLMTLTKKNVLTMKGIRCVEVKTSKTGKDVIQQLPPLVLKIMDSKYEGGFPPRVAEQKFNLRIKEVATKAGLTYADRVVSHTMRRTFCTNAYLENPNAVSDIMRLSGHTTLDNFLRYVRFSKERHQMETKPISFFNDVV